MLTGRAPLGEEAGRQATLQGLPHLSAPVKSPQDPRPLPAATDPLRGPCSRGELPLSRAPGAAPPRRRRPRKERGLPAAGRGAVPFPQAVGRPLWPPRAREPSSATVKRRAAGGQASARAAAALVPPFSTRLPAAPGGGRGGGKE